MEQRSAIPALVALLLAVGAYSFWNTHIGSESAQTGAVVTSQSHMVQANPGNIPVGFPATIPVGILITKSYTLTNPDKHTTQYVVGFVTRTAASDIIGDYQYFFSGNEYAVSSSTDMYISADKENQTVSVTLGKTPAGEREVTVNLLVH